MSEYELEELEREEKKEKVDEATVVEGFDAMEEFLRNETPYIPAGSNYVTKQTYWEEVEEQEEDREMERYVVEFGIQTADDLLGKLVVVLEDEESDYEDSVMAEVQHLDGEELETVEKFTYEDGEIYRDVREEF